MATLPVSPGPFDAGPAAQPLPRSHTVDYVGPTGTMFAIFYKNLILTILTLGIYRFWAKTRLRRFVWANTQVDGEGFEYTGTGKELFLGFLKAVVILVPLFVGLQVIELFVIDESLIGFAILSIFRAVLILGLIYAGTFAARKYRMSRTTWRGIRFRQIGSMWRYAGMALLGFMLSVLTLGLYFPFLQVRLMRYETDNLRFGSARFGFNGRGKALFKTFLVLWGALAVLAAGFAILGIAVAEMQKTGADLDLQSVLGFIPLALMVVLYPLVFWYMGRVARFQAESTRLEGLAFSMPRVNGWRIFTLLLGNTLILGLSLGILFPLTTQRTLRFWIRNLQLAGAIDLDAIAQTERGPRTGEGLAGFFDIDVG